MILLQFIGRSLEGGRFGTDVYRFENVLLQDNLKRTRCDAAGFSADARLVIALPVLSQRELRWHRPEHAGYAV
jgi:hypothetical protein